MKRAIVLILIIGACATSDNERAAADWIKQAPKPVICNEADINGLNGNIDYTLIDAEANIYITGWVSMNLPDTIR